VKSPPAVHGTTDEAKFPLVLLAVLVLILAASGVRPPAGRENWILEIVPGLLGLGALALAFPRLPMSRLVYALVFVHMLVLDYGGFYTYSNTPLGNWARDTLHFSRNHYDRVGHFALGFVPAIVLREVLLRRTPLERGRWLAFLICSVALAIGAFWELLEMWTTFVVAGDVGDAFLGAQGDPWDAQWDMFFVLVGAIVALSTLGAAHDRSLDALFTRAKYPPRR
jgi:putative membrane protein